MQDSEQQPQQETALRLEKTTENNDGRKDIYMRQGDVELLIIRQEAYEKMFTYEEMKTQYGLAKYLMTMAVAMAKAVKPDEVPSDSPAHS